jgi:hypothetical protein
MNEQTAQIVAWGGGALVVATAILGFALTVASGETLFAERLIAGLAGCL